MEDTTFSIVVRTKDRPLLLKRALESIKNQTYKDYEVIIVNDNGDKDVLNNLLETGGYIKDLTQLQVVQTNTHRHMEMASNEGLDRARGRYICIHDDDDSWEPTFLEEVKNTYDMMPVVEKRTTFMTVLAQHNRVFETVDFTTGQIREVCKTNFTPWMHCLHIGQILAGNFIPPISMVYEKEVLQYIGKYDKALPVLGDWDFLIRLMYFTQIKVLKKPVANYHIRVLPSGIYGNSINTEGWGNLHVEHEADVRHKYQYTKVLLPDFTTKDIGSDIVNAKASKTYWHWDYIQEVKGILNVKSDYVKNLISIKNKLVKDKPNSPFKPTVAVYGCGNLYEDLRGKINELFNVDYLIDKKFEQEENFIRNGVSPQNINGITNKIDAVVVCMDHPQDTIRYLKYVDIPVYCITTEY